ncbi:ubiquinol oxidase subunit II [Sphingomonas sp. BAUL-RG-20F-R05-02]|uniref:ubiquinol oxidase subunit II n=1 Tax=Sphingomonas sp. BAUL-RG-20F-R05-02 TaxID=2914830 RepID=UPI001F58C340|nr:ubiquinol oxidase subunit II [Sphingomonas sp. BAUL-RG-20F-R05-02]
MILATSMMLNGCNMVVLHPAGDVAAQQRDLLIIATVLMLLIIVPVLALVALFAWRYRATNKDAHYEPDWDHSTQLELVIWAAPLMIIICLGAVTWVGTHLLDPYRPIERVGVGRPVAANIKPLEVDVVALDWKWLFIYPEYGIATVNELAAPVDRPIAFRITASSVMNAFYVPSLAGMIYAMPGMETRLHAVINKPGDYAGLSANYSGAGFSGMHFRFYGMSNADFNGWIARNKAAGAKLDRATYLKLEQPSEHVPVQRFAAVDTSLFRAAVNLCVKPGAMCADDMMRRDAASDSTPDELQKHGPMPMPGAAATPSRSTNSNTALLTGAGLPKPTATSVGTAIAAAASQPRS